MKSMIMGNNRGISAKFLLFLMVVGALCYGYYRFQATPRYTLMQFKKAVIFSDGAAAEKYLDVESFVQDLPEEMKGNSTREDLVKRIVREIDSPHEKSLFASVKSWSTMKIPIEIDGDSATVEQEDGTVIRLEKISDRQWQITSIQFSQQGTKNK